MREPLLIVEAILLPCALAGGLIAFMEMIFGVARVIAKRIEREELVLTTKEIEEINTADNNSKDFVIRTIMNRRNIEWKSMSFNKATNRLYYWTNYYKG
jgi:hypothetical protein